MQWRYNMLQAHKFRSHFCVCGTFSLNENNMVNRTVCADEKKGLLWTVKKNIMCGQILNN